MENTLNHADYRDEVLKTESKPAELNFGSAVLLTALHLAADVADVMDQVKRAIYYGRDIDTEKMLAALKSARDAAHALISPIALGTYRYANGATDLPTHFLPEDVEHLTPENVDLRLLHAGIGRFTEAGEFLEALIPMLLGGSLDKLNLLEEIGDGAWYDEIGLDALGYSREQCNFVNIKKLNDKKTGRYSKGTFDPNAALNRDVDAERALMAAAAE
jgi:hypothetical protein